MKACQDIIGRLSIAEELKGVPQFRKVHSVHRLSEGWALYCEWLAKQVGWYDNDPFGDLGRFVTNFSARFDWSSIPAFTRNTGPANKRSLTCARKPGWARKKLNPRSSVTSSHPGQACAYKIGMLKIQELRARAQKELGDKFDQREFHDAVLKNGALPLEILEEQVNDYIQRKKG